MKIDELIALLESGSERGNEYDDDLMRKAAETIRVLNAVPASDVRQNTNTDKVVEAINKVVREAVDHGGDAGGAYFGNADRLADALSNLLFQLGVADQYAMDLDGEYFPIKRR